MAAIQAHHATAYLCQTLVKYPRPNHCPTLTHFPAVQAPPPSSSLSPSSHPQSTLNMKFPVAFGISFLLVFAAQATASPSPQGPDLNSAANKKKFLNHLSSFRSVHPHLNAEQSKVLDWAEQVLRDSDRNSAAALHEAAIAAFGSDVAFYLLSGRMRSSHTGIMSRGRPKCNCSTISSLCEFGTCGPNHGQCKQHWYDACGIFGIFKCDGFCH